MPHARYRSLLDDPRFRADLERIDVHGAPAMAYAVEQPDVELEWVLPQPPPPEVLAAMYQRSPLAATGRIILGVVGFFVMLGIGGAAAALVFADRVALILTP